MTRYQTVLFDLDGTLVSEVDGVERATDLVAAALRERGHEVDGSALNAARAEVVRSAMADNRGTWPEWLTRVEWMRRTFRQVSAPEDLAPELAAVYLAGRLDGLALIDHAVELVEAVQREAPSMGLITNGDGREQRAKLARVGLDRFFPNPLISAELGTQKPKPAIFEQALGAVGAKARESVYIGNSYGNDVEGAAGVGMDTVWLDQAGSGSPAGAAVEPTYTASTLREVRAFLGV